MVNPHVPYDDACGCCAARMLRQRNRQKERQSRSGWGVGGCEWYKKLEEGKKGIRIEKGTDNQSREMGKQC